MKYLKLRNISIFFFLIFSFYTKAQQEPEWVIEPKYEMVKPFSEGLAMVKLNGKWGFINKRGENITEFIYDNHYYGGFSEGRAVVAIGKYPNVKYGFIDKNGKEITEIKYNHLINNFSDGMATVGIGKYPNIKYGFIDKSGKEVIPLKYDMACPFSEGLAAVYIGSDPYGYDSEKGWRVINKIGKEIIPQKYDVVVSNMQYGFADVFFRDELLRVAMKDPVTKKINGVL